MSTVQRVSTHVAIDIETILDLLAPHVEDLIDDKLEQVLPEGPGYSWSNYGFGPGDIEAAVIDGCLVVAVDFDLHED